MSDSEHSAASLPVGMSCAKLMPGASRRWIVGCGPVERFINDDQGQDLVEYALITGFIGIAGWAILTSLPAVIGETYTSWVSPTGGVPALWDPPDPEAGGS